MTGRSTAWLRDHALFLAALALGVAIRVVVVVAYRPALVFYDSQGYLTRAEDFSISPLRPAGYSLFLKPLVALTGSVQHDLTVVQLVQHAVGLGLAVACYAFLVHRFLPRWGATLAVLPLLLDPLQLVLEHYVLSDVLFEALVVAACLLVLWRRRPTATLLVLAGLAVGSAALVRGAGSFLVVVFLVALVCLRPGWIRIGAFLAAAVVPIAAYAVAFHHAYGEYATSNGGPRFLYARIAPIVDCRDPQLDLPAYERVLCPGQPVGERPSTDYYMWGQQRGPQYQVEPPPGMTDLQLIKDFDKRVVRSQPLTYTSAVLKDLAGGFAWSRTYHVPGYPASYWLFVDHYWAEQPGRYGVSVSPGAAGFMQTYRTWLWTPGPVMAALLLVALAATFGLGRSRRSGDRVAVGLMAGACLITLLTGAALSGFSWRYQLPQVPLLPMAGALGLAALLRGRALGAPEPREPLLRWDRAWARPVVIVLFGALVAVVVTGVAVGSGWFLPGPAAVLGVATGVGSVVICFGARGRWTRASSDRESV